MEEGTQKRKDEGVEILRDHLSEIAENAEVFLGALKGFRRDLALSSTATAGQISGEFTETALVLSVPPLVDGMSFSDLRQMLTLCTSTLFGKINKEDVLHSMYPEEKQAFLEEVAITHKNLADLASTANHLYESIKRASYDFDVFNAENLRSGYVVCDIRFNRDALNVAMETARALCEGAVRLDIDFTDADDR